jgi:phosphate transport system substrate-binding protein
VEPTAEAFKAASARTDWAHAPGFFVVLTDQPGHDAWPIAGATFILVYKNPSDPNAQKEALKFFKWAYENGDAMAEEKDYVPLPQSTKDEIYKSWQANILPAALP